MKASKSLEDDLGWTLGVVFRWYIKAANAVVNDLPGGPRGYQVLAAAAQNQADRQSTLAQRLGVDRTVMTYLIDDLEKAGLVERKPDPADRRNRQILATEQGQALWTDVGERLQYAEDQVLGMLAQDERETFRALLRRVAARANELDPVESACQIVEELETPS
jgi:DNA-binding MarR family transcriptional regulator